jgi:hypothetical protein
MGTIIMGGGVIPIVDMAVDSLTRSAAMKNGSF